MTHAPPSRPNPSASPEAREAGTAGGEQVGETPSRATGQDTPRYNAAGERRPAFFKDLPADPVVERLARLFEAGDYGRLRQEARVLLSQQPSPEQAAAVRELLARTRASGPLRWMLGACIALFVVVVAWVYTHNP